MLRWIYRHYRAALVLLMVVGLGAALALGVFPQQLLASELMIVGLPWVVWFDLNFAAAARLSADALRLWNDQCDPEPLLAFSLDGVQRYTKGSRAKAKKALCDSHINASAALDSLGRFSEALEHLDEAAALPLTEEGAVLLWLNRSAVFCNLEEPEAMANCLSMAEQALAAAALKPAQRAPCASVLEQNRLAHRLLTEGPGPEVEAGYQELLIASKTTREKVSRHFALAQCALARDDKAAAREHLEYIIAHGNKLHTRTQAIQLWEEQGFPPR